MDFNLAVEKKLHNFSVSIKSQILQSILSRKSTVNVDTFFHPLSVFVYLVKSSNFCLHFCNYI